MHPNMAICHLIFNIIICFFIKDYAVMLFNTLFWSDCAERLTKAALQSPRNHGANVPFCLVILCLISSSIRLLYFIQ